MDTPRPLFLFTDFGWSGPYVGQLAAAALAVDPAVPLVNLMHDAPAMRPDLAAYLLRGCIAALPRGAIVVAVVDPGVGGERDALVVETDTLTLIGPDNGLLSRIEAIRAVSRLDWRPTPLSASFHGRDLFVPAAARLARGDAPPAMTPVDPGRIVGADWPESLEQIVYVDAYGNAMTGVDGKKLSENRALLVDGRRITYAETFCRVPLGGLFWYRNSQSLVEIAGNSVSAASALSLALGDSFLID